MTQPTTPPLARASALPNSSRPGRPDYDMITQLRTAQTNGNEAVIADEEYDPDFAIKLSNCTTIDTAEALLDEWLDKRIATLKQTQAALRKAWAEGQADPEKRP